MSDPVTLNYPLNKTLSSDTVSTARMNGDDILVVADITNMEGVTPEENGDGNIQFSLEEDLTLYINLVPAVEFDTSTETTELNYKGIKVHIFANDESEPGAGDAFTEHCFFVKSVDSYFLCTIEEAAYVTYTGETNLPESIAKYIDALTIYIDGEVAELSDAPEE